ncbi:MAG: hypothetical protein L6282_02910 [Candidatus Methanoperedenaceae archaeon]|nr:hypothetical protein [Candidatus Methanoperedenaceae archaeon]
MRKNSIVRYYSELTLRTIYDLRWERRALKEFFKNLNYLYFNAKSPGKSISFMMKYPLKEIPGLIYLAMKVSKQMKEAYKDYEI